MIAEPAPVRRSDAARNRDKILSAARAAFATPAAAEVSMAEVARQAGVGMATLYRNFPGRRELLEALLTEEVDELCAAASAPGGTDLGGKSLGGTDAGGTHAGGTNAGGTNAGGADPGSTDPGSTDAGSTDAGVGLTSWLRLFAAFLSSKHRIAAELLKHTDAGDPVFGGSRDRVVAAGRPLLVAAQAAGEARAELTIEQAMDLVIAVVTISDDQSYIEPILAAALDGLRPAHA